MPVAPVALAALLVIADWGVWDWAIGSDHGVVALVAGLAMAPLVVAFAWFGALALGTLTRRTLQRLRSELRRYAQAPPPRPRTTALIGESAEPEPERLAA